ncbi:hypothetical protein [Periweissella cryptocerci]|nr:hypothetical protein [Periweissella cryptocerci]
MHELLEQRTKSVARVNEARKNLFVAGFGILVILGTTAVHIFA